VAALCIGGGFKRHRACGEASYLENDIAVPLSEEPTHEVYKPDGACWGEALSPGTLESVAPTD